MTINWVAVVEGGIPVLGGLYATALGYGWVKARARPDGTPHPWLRHLRWLGPLVVLFGLFLGWQAYQQTARPSADSLAADISAKLELPVQVDEATRLDAVAGSGNTLTYRYTVTVPVDAANVATFEQLMREQTRKAACTDPGFAEILRSGYTVEMRYTFSEPARELSIVTAPEACSPPAS